MEKLTRIEYDATTKTETIIELTEAEVAQLELDKIEAQAILAERESERLRVEELKSSARTKLVAGTPLTEEEAALLVL
jgi:hypothetical protein